MDIHIIKNGNPLRTVVGIIMLILLLSGSANAATLTVDDSGGADYTVIQNAINAATAGDTILVYSGTYFENVNVNKQLTVRGIGMPVVDARGIGNPVTLAGDGIILEGMKAILSGSSKAGIKVTSKNNKLNGNNASNNSYGIFLYSSSNNTVIGNNLSNNNIGIQLSSSSNNTFSGNNANSNNEYGIHLDSSSNSNILSENNANYNSLRGIHIDSTNNNTLSGNNANYNGEHGIDLSRSSNNKLSWNNANSNTEYGILLGSSSDNNILIGNNANYNDQRGIHLDTSSNNTLNGNNASSNIEYGIWLDFSSNNSLIGNNASNNTNGFYFSLSDYNELSSNTLNSNHNYGIYLTSSIENDISNNIFNNTNNAHVDTPNIWNTTKIAGNNIIGGSYLGGNFWANPSGTGFSQTCTDGNKDGICDSSYTLDSYNNDYLPLAYGNSITPTLVDSYLPPGASPAERKAGLIRAMDDYFDNGALTKAELLSVLDAYFA